MTLSKANNTVLGATLMELAIFALCVVAGLIVSKALRVI